jgi:hypothetical protein
MSVFQLTAGFWQQGFATRTVGLRTNLVNGSYPVLGSFSGPADQSHDGRPSPD